MRYIFRFDTARCDWCGAPARHYYGYRHPRGQGMKACGDCHVPEMDYLRTGQRNRSLYVGR